MSELELRGRPLCADVAAEAREDLAATASRVTHWLLIEQAGEWPYDPLAAPAFSAPVRKHLFTQLAALPRSRLLLVKRSRSERSAGVRVMYGTTRERGSRFYSLQLASADELRALDLAAALRGAREHLGEPLAHPLLLVCTHGKRDRCCARYGHPVCESVHASPSAAPWAWQSTHVGGDRFAGNVVCLPEGFYFGRVDRAATGPLVDAYRAGRIDLEHYRGRSCYSFPAQAAELRVRRDVELDGFWDLRLRGARSTGDGAWRIRFEAEVAGALYDVDVRRELGPPAFLTCRADERRRPRRYVVTSVTAA